MAAIRKKWPDGCDLIHLHNPLLAKNKAFLSILKILQDQGERLFLQVHDLAEDGRPNHYYAGQAYPTRCHFGVINSRDFKIFMNAGANQDGLHRKSFLEALFCHGRSCPQSRPFHRG